MLVAIPTKIEDFKRFGNQPVAKSALVIANVVLFTFAQTPTWHLVPGGGWWCFLIVPVLELWGLMWCHFSLGAWQSAHPAHLLGLICGVVIVLLLSARITLCRRAEFS